jgi:small subunit ribosomal protein S20
MANIKSQKKRILTSEKDRQANQHFRSHMRTMIKKAVAALAAPSEETQTAVRNAISAIDRACTKGVLHRNAAARKKSELQHRAAHLQH